MRIVKISNDRYINVENVTHVSARADGSLIVAFIVPPEANKTGLGIDTAFIVLKDQEAMNFKRWLDTNSENT